MGKKLIRGLGNAILGVAEFPGQIVKGCREKTWDFGVITGIWYWFSREIDGTWDICSFYLPNPATPNELTFTEEWPWDALMGKSAGK
jgi:putative exosortase-associated protein (TIGR04073 family)